MNLKKINLQLKRALEENDFTEANEMQSETFSTIKSGADAVIQSSKKSGKTTTIALNVIQKIQKAEGESTRALILVEDKESVLEMVDILEKFSNYTDIRVFGTHEKGDIDYDKNQISLGVDVLVGTTNRINEIFASAGFNINTIKMLIVDNVDDQARKRLDTIIIRLSNSIEKTQRLFFCTDLTEKVEILADKIMIEPIFFEMDTNK